MKAGKTGYEAEETVYRLLVRNLRGREIHWTRKELRANAPFDFEIFQNGRAILLLEVKGLSETRKHYWTQYKRPAIKRKIARMRELGNPRAITVVVRQSSKSPKIRWTDGFPSQPFEKFRSNLEKLLGEIDAIHP